MLYQRDVIPCQEGNAALDNIPGGLAPSRGVFFNWGCTAGYGGTGRGMARIPRQKISKESWPRPPAGFLMRKGYVLAGQTGVWRGLL